MDIICSDSYDSLDATPTNFLDEEAIFYIGFGIWINPLHSFHHIL
jgi:hypothetical protein